MNTRRHGTKEVDAQHADFREGRRGGEATVHAADTHISTWRQSAIAASTLFLLSRCLIFGIWAIISCLQYAPSADGNYLDASIQLDSTKVEQALEKLALSNDAGWYHDIVTNGYEERPFDTTRQANWAFFPLHPALWRLLALTGLDDAFAGLLLANLYFLLALIVVHRLVFALGYGPGCAYGSILFLAFCPTSYFFSLPWSESLFLLLTSSTFFAATKEKWLLAFVFGALACSTRFAAVFLVPALLLYAWERHRLREYRPYLSALAMPVGLAMFSWILWRACGNPAAFADIQISWGRHLVIPYKALGIVILKPFVLATDWNLRPLNFAAFFLGCAACYWLAKKREGIPLALFLLLGLLAPALTGSITSMARYVFVLFPFAVAAGHVLQSRTCERLFLMISVAILVMMTVGFQLTLSFAGA